MSEQHIALLSKSVRLAWLSSLTEAELRALAQSWQLTQWKNTDTGVLRLQLAQIEGVETPLKGK